MGTPTVYFEEVKFQSFDSLSVFYNSENINYPPVGQVSIDLSPMVANDTMSKDADTTSGQEPSPSKASFPLCRKQQPGPVIPFTGMP